MWNELHWTAKLLILSGETLVAVSILAESRELARMLKGGKSKEECLGFVESSF